MKKIILSFCVTFFTLYSSAQVAYYDAIALKDLSVSQTVFREDAALILNKYYKLDFTGGALIAKLNDTIKSNPFLKDFKINAGSLSDEGKFKSFSFASLKGLDVTTFADGLAKFLVARVKEELSITFFKRFKEDLKKYPDLKTLFPATYTWLEAIDTEAYQYTSYLSMLREAFIKDFQVIIPNLKEVVSDPRHDAYFKTRPPLRSLFLFALDITEGLQHGDHPGEIIHTLAARDFTEFNTVEPNIKPSFETLDMVIQSLRSKDAGHYLVPFDSVKRNLFNERTFKLYLGLIYQVSGNITFHTTNQPNRPLRIILEEIAVSAQKLADFKAQYERELREITARAEIVQQAITKIKEQNRTPGSKATYAEYYEFYDATLNLIEYVSEIPDLVKPYLGDFRWSRHKDFYFFIARKVGDIYLDVNEKKYSSVVLNLAIVYDTLLNRPVDVKSTEIAERFDSIRAELDKIAAGLQGDAKKKVEQQIAGLQQSFTGMDQKDVATKKGEIFSTMLRVGNFAATVASAENSDQVKEAIEAAALPPGSARIKRDSYLNVSLNAYVGFFAGNEHIRGLEPHNDAFSTGLFAPVGIAFSRGGLKRSDSKGGKSLSGFVSLIDVGALAAFRFAEDSAAVAPDIKLGNILSPGIFLVYGLGRCPISIGAGVQAGPQLREVSIPGNSISNDFYVRAHAFIAVDIPVINLYNRRHK
jgi:hypothetical protein